MTTPKRPPPGDPAGSEGAHAPVYTDPDVLRAVATVFKRSRREIESEVNGTSMGRTIPHRSRIRIRCGHSSDWKKGTVISFFAGRTLLTHRVVGRGIGSRSRSYWLTRGDGALVCDPPVAGDAVLGEVIAWNPNDSWEAVPGPARTSLGRRLASKATELVTWMALEIHAGFAREVAIGMARITRAVRRLLPM